MKERNIKSGWKKELERRAEKYKGKIKERE